MKLLFGLVCLMAIYSTSAVVVTDFTPFFLMGTWYTNLTAGYNQAGCCVPNGTITFDSSSTNGIITMTASQYAGGNCANENVHNGTTKTLPFDSSISYYELPHSLDTDTTDEGPNQDLYLYLFNNLAYGSNFTNNNTPITSFTLQIYLSTEVPCTNLQLYKGETNLKIGFFSLTALVALLSLLVF